MYHGPPHYRKKTLLSACFERPIDDITFSLLNVSVISSQFVGFFGMASSRINWRVRSYLENGCGILTPGFLFWNDFFLFNSKRINSYINRTYSSITWFHMLRTVTRAVARNESKLAHRRLASFNMNNCLLSSNLFGWLCAPQFTNWMHIPSTI